MKTPSRHLLPVAWRRTGGPGSIPDPTAAAADSIPQAHYGKRPARWADDRAMLLSVTTALAQAEQRLCDLVRDDPAPPAELVGLFVKDVTRLRREEQMLRDHLAGTRIGGSIRRALATRRIKPLLRCLARRLG